METGTKGLGLAISLAVLMALSSLPSGEAAGSESLARRITDGVTEFITGRVTLPHDSISVEVDVPAIAARAGDVARFSLDLFGSSDAVMGTVPVKVTLFLNDGGSTACTATARVRIWSQAAVAARRLKRHEVVEENDIRLERREVTRVFDGYFVSADDIVGKRTTRTVSSGALFSSSSVEPVPMVTRGSDVSVMVVIGAVAITTRGKALEDGDLGGRIKVRDCTTGKRLTGEVAGEDLVLLEVSRF